VRRWLIQEELVGTVVIRIEWGSRRCKDQERSGMSGPRGEGRQRLESSERGRTGESAAG
jgi:hypothetical protein